MEFSFTSHLIFIVRGCQGHCQGDGSNDTLPGDGYNVTGAGSSGTGPASQGSVPVQCPVSGHVNGTKTAA